MDLKNQNGAGVQENLNANKAANSATTINDPKAGMALVGNAMTANYEVFIEFLNDIYWEGYAEQLARENPTALQAEHAAFFNNYIFK
jgi:hypothetical protein